MPIITPTITLSDTRIHRASNDNWRKTEYMRWLERLREMIRRRG